MTEYNDQITFKISDERRQWIDDQVELRDSNRSDIIRRSLGVAEKATLDYSGDGEASRERVEELEQENQSLRYKLDRRESEIDRLETEIEEHIDLGQEMNDVTLLMELIGDDVRALADLLTEHKESLEEFDGRLDEVASTAETESEAVRSALADEMKRVRKAVEKIETTIIDEREQRDEHWDHRTGELAERLDAIEADLEAMQKEIETDDDGGLF